MGKGSADSASEAQAILTSFTLQACLSQVMKLVSSTIRDRALNSFGFQDI